MNFGQMQSLLTLMMGNMIDTDPFYTYIVPTSGMEEIGVLYRATNELVRMKIGPNQNEFDAFPELRNTWTVGPTVLNQNVIAYPSDMLVATAISSADQSTLPDWTSAKEIPVTYTPPDKFGLLTKDSTATGYPRLFTRKGQSIIINPTPQSSADITYLRIYGIARQKPLTDASQSFSIGVDYHSAIVHLAAHLLATEMGWSQKSAEFLSIAQRELGLSKDFVAEESFSKDLGPQIDFPTRTQIYGSSF